MLTFKQPEGVNLVSLYDTVEITIEPNPDTKPASSGLIAYSFTLPADGLEHVRNLLSSSQITPDKKPLIDGLMNDIKTIDELASAMQKAADSGNKAHVDQNAEAIRNIIVGAQSPSHVDADKNGTVEDPSDGFGLRLNGQNQGYLEAVYGEAKAAVNSKDASQPMITYGQGLMNSVQNLAQWTPELQDMMTAILAANDPADVKLKVANAVALATKMLHGIDADTNGAVDPILGEGGAQTAYDQAYHMADMPLQTVGISNIGTGTPTFIVVPATKPAGSNGGGGGGVTPQPPQKPRNTPKPENTHKPPKGNGSNANTNTTDTNNGGGNSNKP
jgi:hypothetical protein